MRKSILLFVLILLALVSVSCGTKRAIVYRDDALTKTILADGGIGYYFPDSLDARGIVQEYVAIFGGDVGGGVRYTLDALHKDMNVGFNLVISPPRFVDLSQESTASEMDALIQVEKDEYGVISLTIPDTAQLSAVLDRAGVRYLLYFPCFVATTGHAGATSIGANIGQGLVFVPSADVGFGALGSQGFLWSADQRSIAWNGFVTGKQALDGGSSHEDVLALVHSFSKDLASALWWEIPRELGE